MRRDLLIALAVIGLGVAVSSADAGLSAVTYEKERSALNSKAIKSETVDCGSGEFLTGAGGASILRGGTDVAVTASRPAGTGGSVERWTGEAAEVNPTSEDWRLVVWAVCLDN